MKKFHLTFIFIIFINLYLIDCFPCPLNCLCKPMDIIDEDFKRMNYLIDCQNVKLNGNQLISQAQSWSILNDILTDDNDDLTYNDYIISIDLSKSPSLKEFNNQTIILTNFSYIISSLSLANQSNDFILHKNSFHSNLYQNLKVLNLSSCCQRIPSECSQLFRPLNQLEILDLSGSDMYKTCLNQPDTFSSNFRDLILQNNVYSSSTFSHSSEIFNGVRYITGKLDLKYSHFHMGTRLEGNCLFDLFTNITILDLSFIEFQSISNDTNIHLTHLIRCRIFPNRKRNGEQLIELYLQQINLYYLPDWFTNDRFPLLNYLDLSKNKIHRINFQEFTNLKILSLAFNPIQLNDIQWRSNYYYQSINLRSINVNQTLNLTKTMEYLFQYSTNIDYSENIHLTSTNLEIFPIEIDFFDKISLNLSQTNLNSFQINDLSKFDSLTHLDLSQNKLNELNLIKQINLNYLDCSYNNLTKIIFNSNGKNFHEIKCSNNNLKNLENFFLFKHKNIQIIDFSYNQFQTLDELFSQINNRNLRIINFQSNFIEKLSSNLFSKKLISLYSINLSFNQINFIEKYTFQLPNLQILDLTGNPLKFIELNFILTSSLRLFYIFNDTKQFILRCTQSKSNDHLLSTYLTWLEENNTSMMNIEKNKYEQIHLDKCLKQYISRSKIKWMKFNDKYPIKYLSLYVILIIMSIGIFLAGIYWYKKKERRIFGYIQHYRQLDRNHLIEQREDDEIVMNLEEPPFNINDRTI